VAPDAVLRAAKSRQALVLEGRDAQSLSKLGLFDV
jgi:hypothetical protein